MGADDRYSVPMLSEEEEEREPRKSSFELVDPDEHTGRPKSMDEYGDHSKLNRPS